MPRQKKIVEEVVPNDVIVNRFFLRNKNEPSHSELKRFPN
jgi:hypothetical protein